MPFRFRLICWKLRERSEHVSKVFQVANSAQVERPCRRSGTRLAGWLPGRAILVVVLLVAGPLVWAQVAAPPGLDGTPEVEPDKGRRSVTGTEENRVREGTELTDVLGYFTMTGSRVTFVAADSGTRFAGLENLNLERISKIISKAPKKMDWNVSGEVTEYRGANYLLVRRAILKTGAGMPQDTRHQP